MEAGKGHVRSHFSPASPLSRPALPRAAAASQRDSKNVANLHPGVRAKRHSRPERLGTGEM